MKHTHASDSRPCHTVASFTQKLIHTLKALRPKTIHSIAHLAPLIPDQGVIFDVGGFFGYYSRQFARLNHGSCRVYTFEPFSYNHTILRRTTYQRNITLFNHGLAAEAGEDTIHIPIKRHGRIGPALAHLGPEAQRQTCQEQIQLKRLDQVVETEGIKRLDFIKCDVEGAELGVFQGGMESLKRFQPIVLCEINQDYTQRLGVNAQELFDLFIGLDYRIYDFSQETLTIQATANTYRKPSDYLFIPNQERILARLQTLSPQEIAS